MHPILFHAGSFKLPGYGLMVAFGYIAAVLYLFRNQDGSALSREQTADLIFYPALSGILGAKALFAATYWEILGTDTTSRLISLLETFPYGFVFYGGFAAGAAAFFLYCRLKKLDFLAAADYFAPALALAHGFGRLGCFLAGCCYGRPSQTPFSVVFMDPMCEVPQMYLGVPLHPAQLYEAAGNFLIFGGLVGLARSKKAPRTGLVFAAYMASYSTLRFSVEFLRGDDRGGEWMGLSPAQLASLIVAAAALALIRNLLRKPTK
jgi:phosphatidylglycerol:prolipoprotein diacylglycerol transferase